MYIASNVIIDADTAITIVNRKFIIERKGIPVKSGKRIKDVGIATTKAIIEVKIIKAIYALNAISVPPCLS
jgi:hypothetical protein